MTFCWVTNHSHFGHSGERHRKGCQGLPNLDLAMSLLVPLYRSRSPPNVMAQSDPINSGLPPPQLHSSVIFHLFAMGTCFVAIGHPLPFF